MNAALAAPSLRAFTAVRIELSTGPINLIDGSGFVTFAVAGVSTVFDGSDPTFGALAGVSSAEERVATTAPRLRVSLMPPTATAVGALSDPENQNALVYVWWGVVNDTTGTVIGSPELLWLGRLDTVTTRTDENMRVCEIDTISAFDRLFAAEEGARLTGTWHKAIWPGETGLDFNIAATHDPFWGAEGPPRPAVTPTGGGVGGGSSGGSSGGSAASTANALLKRLF
ncbi:MAG TPA: hypothetical protein VGB79_01725 [Allosphingosinicella sp.]